VIRSKRRDDLKAFAGSRDQDGDLLSDPATPPACYRHLGYGPGDFPESERAARETLALPIYPELTETQQAFVVDSITQFYRSYAAPEPL
jgi:dTDP-4-amino-4,6-dideoxygalactose transaminase